MSYFNYKIRVWEPVLENLAIKISRAVQREYPYNVVSFGFFQKEFMMNVSWEFITLVYGLVKHSKIKADHLVYRALSNEMSGHENLASPALSLVRKSKFEYNGLAKSKTNPKRLTY